MAKKQDKLTLANNEGQTHLKPYCEESKVAAEHKAKADELRVKATEELRKKLDSDPETRDFTGTVVCIFDDQVYKIRVQRKASCNWLEKHLNDPLLKDYKTLIGKIDDMKESAKQMEENLAKAHPKCVNRELSIAFMSK